MSVLIALRFLTFFFTLAVVSYSFTSGATELPGFTPPPVCVDEFRNVIVGDMANDASCDFNDLQSAINSAYTNSQCFTTVHVTGEHLYTNQALVIEGNRNITLAGWANGVTCADVRNNACSSAGCQLPAPATNPLVTISGGVGNSVIHIDGNSIVSLLNLTITGGTVSVDQKGGGIYFDGTGSLTLASTTVSLNGAGYGGGINMNGDGGAASLFLNDYSQILVNSVGVSGGGIRLEGNARLYALKPRTLIGFNKALNGYGGGIEVIGPARADIGSSGFGSLPVIYSNDAAYGGGMDILSVNDGEDAVVRVFTTDPNNPVQISDNFASQTGGAVYLKRLYGSFGNAQAELCAFDFRIENNAAQEGSAIYSDTDHSDLAMNNAGGSINLNTVPSGSTDLCLQPELPTALGAVACAKGVTCNTVSGNKSEDENSQPTAGSAILLQDGSYILADRFVAQHNSGAHVIRQIGAESNSATYAALTNCLLSDNALTGEVIAQTGGDNGRVDVKSCTVVGNTDNAANVFADLGTFTLSDSIIDQPGLLSFSTAITDPTKVVHVLTTDKSSMPDTVYIQQGEPSFVNAAGGDYHLMSSSLGIDSAPVDNTLPGTSDLDRNPRVVDLPDIANNFGPMDLGAYELQSDGASACTVSDTIFCNGFELN